jgi:peroxiredoxin
VIRAALCAALLLCACGGNAARAEGPEGGGTRAADRPSDGARPPDFELSTLDGKSVRLSDHLGKDVVLIDFWATFCDPCLAAMPHLEALYQKHKQKGFVVLAISIDGPDSLGLVKTEVSKLGITFPVLLDQETRVVALYNPKTSAPYSVLIGRDGNVIVKKEGYTTGAHGALDRDIEAAVAK